MSAEATAPTTLDPGLATFLRLVNETPVRYDPDTGQAWLDMPDRRVDVTARVDEAELYGYVDLNINNRYFVNRAGVQALVAAGGRS